MNSYQVLRFGAPLARTEQDMPSPQGTEVLLRVVASGVCHTDIHIWQGGYDLGAGERLSMEARGVSLPLTLGHEIVGEVVATGHDAVRLSRGERYLVYPWIGCGACKVCRRGQDHVCPAPRTLGVFRPGGYSDHVIVPDARYLVDIGPISATQAAPYACSGLTVYSALRKIHPAILSEERVVILGAGGLGLMAVSLLNALGGAGAVIVEPDAARRDAAIAMGAKEAIDPTAPDFLTRVKDAAGGSVWAVLDCVGAAQTVRAGLDLLVKGGHFVQVGLLGGRIDLPTPTLPLRSLTYQGSFVGSLRELHDLIALVREKSPTAIPISCRPLHEATAALDELARGLIVGRVILQS